MLEKSQMNAASAYVACTLLFMVVPANLLAAGNISETVCIHSESTASRSIKLVYENETSPIPCRVLYGENGVLDELASAKNTKGFCEKKERQIARNLVNAGWKCSHSLFGASKTRRTDLTLNLFPENLRHTAVRTESDVELEQHQMELAAEFESEHRERMQKELAEIFESQLGDGFSVAVDIDASIAIDRTAAPSSTSKETRAATHFGAGQGMESEPGLPGIAPPQFSHALMSKPFGNEHEAHRFAAELRRIYPHVTTRVSQNLKTSDQWSVVLGVANAASELDSVLAQFDEGVKNYFSLVNLSKLPTETDVMLSFVSSDWPRYLIAACYSDGYSTLLSMAECSGFDLDVDSFMNCVSGSVCSPDQFSGILSEEDIDLVDFIGTADPVAAARGILANSVRGCESINNLTNDELAECVAMSILDEEQQLIMECHTQSESLAAMLECAGGEEVSELVSLYDQCGQNELSGVRCLADAMNNDKITRSVDCLNAGNELAIANCVAQSNAGIDTSATVQCLEASAGLVEQLSCVADGQLDDQQQLLLTCATGFPSATGFASCSLQETGVLTTEQWATAECMLEGKVTASSVLDCAGGRFASVEIAQCVADDIELNECFATQTIISDVIDDTVADIFDVSSLASMQNEIALFRENLYALEGGDLAAVFADPSKTDWLNNTAEEAAKAADSVKNDLKETTKGLLNKIGFGK